MNNSNDIKFRRKPGILLKVEFNFTILALMLLAGAILVFCFFIFEQFRTQLTFSSAIIGGLAAIYAGYYVAVNIKITNEREKVHRSFEIIHRLDIPDTVRVRWFIEKGDIDPEKDASVNIYKKINEDFELQVAVTSMLSILENLSIAVQRGYADEVTIYLSTCVQVPFYYKKLSSYIGYIRGKYKNNAICIEFEKLARSWKSKRFLSSNKNIPKEILQE